MHRIFHSRFFFANSSIRCFAMSLLIALPIFSGPARGGDEKAAKTFVAFVLRHAEKEKNGGDNPELTIEGRRRAAQLADLLRDAGITHVYATKWRRTQDTAAPIASALGLEVQEYKAKEIPELATKVMQSGGRSLIVGHSNSVPETVHQLGGESGTPIDDSGEFDRLYIVTGGEGGTASTVLLRYGAPYTGK